MWIGADPGGKGNFGVAIFDGYDPITNVFDCAGAALEFVIQRAEDSNWVPQGVGIDAPLWWSLGPGGSRKVDEVIRNNYKLHSGTVQTVNSLRGAALVQGLLFAQGLRTKFPMVGVTECHPKALLGGVYKNNFEDFAQQYKVPTPEKFINKSEHERDAIIAAVCARETFIGDWEDLARSIPRMSGERALSELLLGDVRYGWPNLGALSGCSKFKGA